MLTLSQFSQAAQAYPSIRRGTTVVIGNFDGAHLGHQLLIKRAKEHARGISQPLIALSFSPHPRVFFGSLNAAHLIFSPSQKERALQELQVDLHIAQTFDHHFAHISAYDFIHKVLVEALYANTVYIGENFYFGAQRKGDAQYLASELKSLGRSLHITPPTTTDCGQMLSSSKLREMVQTADIASLNRYLGRPLLIEGIITKGDALGSKLGYSTANIPVPHNHPLHSLHHGVYAGYACFPPISIFQILNKMSVIVNYGTRPTIHPEEHHTTPILEAHLLDGLPTGTVNLYGQMIGIYLTHFLRKEQFFASEKKLTAQIKQDIQHAHTKLQSYPLQKNNKVLQKASNMKQGI